MLKTLGSIQRTAKTILWAVIFVVVLIGIIVGWDVVNKWLVAIGGGLVALLGGMKVSDQKKLRKIKNKNQALKDDIEKQQEIKADLDTQAESWREKLNKLYRGGLMLIICAGLCLVSGPAWAAIEGDIYIPEDYEELKVLYIEAMELLDEADKIISEHQSLATDQSKTIQTQATMINELEQDIFRLSRPVWGVTGGVEFADSARFMMGLSRRYNSTSWTIGFTKGEQLGIFGMYSLWLQNPF